jgi:hypothetical protein
LSAIGTQGHRPVNGDVMLRQASSQVLVYLGDERIWDRVADIRDVCARIRLSTPEAE